MTDHVENHSINLWITLPIILLVILTLSCSLLPEQRTPRATEESIPGINSAVVEDNGDGSPAASDSLEKPLIDPPPEEAGSCSNPLYPLVPGYQWNYKVNSRSESTEISMTVTEVEGNQALMDVSYIDSGITSEVKVDCDDGEILNFPTILLGFLFGDVSGKIEIENVSGVFAPDYDYLVKNIDDAEWSGEYLASGEISAVVDGDEFIGTLSDSPLVIDWKVTPEGETIFDDIEVAAGSYDNALRTTSWAELDFDASLTEDGVTTSLVAVLELTTINWYVPNTGMVKQEVTESSIRVFGVRFPLYMKGEIELLQFSMEE